MASGDTRTQQYLGIAANGNRADLPSETCCETRTQTLVREVAERVIGLDEEVQEMKNNPDVVDIVDTYQDLTDYDTSTLTDKDIIRVLQDSTHGGNSTYYRWNSATEEFDFVGEISAGASIMYIAYYPGDDPADPSTSSLYADATLTTKLTGGDFWNILASGKPVVLRFNDTSQNEIYTFSFLYSRLPSENTPSGFDHYAPEAFFNLLPNDVVSISFAAGDPDITDGFAISIFSN